MIRDSSREALNNLDIQAKEKAILRAVLKRKDMTRNEIARATGFSINSVTGRVNRMVKLNYLEEVGRRKDRVTGNNNYAVRA